MGMYTELIFGASLKEDTPKDVIDTLSYMIGDKSVKPDNYPFPEGRHEYLFRGASYYFGVCGSVSRMWLDDITKQWCISTRSNIKNYSDEIQVFLEWIKPHIEYGSGIRNMYAIVTYEEGESEIYYLD